MAGETNTEQLDPQTFGNAETATFWNAAKEGRLLIKHCTACDEHHWYPRTHCPHCGSGETEWVESRGEGSIYTFTVLRRNGGQIPCYVTLDEGISIFTNIVDCDPDDLAIGKRVRVRFREERNGTSVPVFVLSEQV
ncbi:DNA-binding protein [Nitratireductor aestuarii]|uniref:DNA-binding protein n=1 Tax=Nitratireductor aestuarii TaxID=1735103 RepID=A0A916W829_9HYPH|nr:zinc ribbon domain-containing protein [Nitratireductor aestuarii]GGA74706.1 DNA-binding protein [Nitratireductor aestuarii]